MRKLFTSIFICLFLSSLYSEEPLPRLSAESEQLAVVANCVNVISGDFFQIDPDIHSNHQDAVNYIRYYDSGSCDSPRVLANKFGMEFPIFFEYRPYQDKYQVIVEQRQSSLLPFLYKEKTETGTIDPKIFNKGYTNYSRDASRIKEARVERLDNHWCVSLSDGTKRFYQYNGAKSVSLNQPGPNHSIPLDFTGVYRLYLEEKPNGNKVHFVYNSKTSWQPERIYTTNSDQSLILSELDFKYHGHDSINCTISSDNHQKTLYSYQMLKGKVNATFNNRYQQMLCLIQAQADYFPCENYEYIKKSKHEHNLLKISKISKPEGRYLSLNYNHLGKVSKISSPSFQYTFKYEHGRTEVIDSLNRKQTFLHKNGRLNEIVDPDYRRHCYDWEKNGNLTQERLVDSSKNPLWKRNFTYDGRGNLTNSTLVGEITGNVIDQARTYITYSNDGFNLPTKEIDPCGIQTHYQYKPGTNLLISKRIIAQNQCQERAFYTYDKNAILIQTIEDDGSSEDAADLTDVTNRFITEIIPQLDKTKPGFTQPKITSEFYLDLQTGEKKLIKRVEHDYIGDLLTAQQIYDSEGKYQHSISKKYNNKRQLIQETNPLGETIEYSYDANFNKVYEEKIGSGKKVYFQYDKANRVIRKTEEHVDGPTLSTYYSYDAVGNLISEKDAYGQITKYKYDNYNRLVKQIDPLGNEISKTYDIADNETSVTDPDGYTTYTTYNVLGKPLHIQYPDGTEERFTYTLKGQLATKTNRDQSVETVTYDYKENPIEEAAFSPEGTLLRRTICCYKGKNLLSETDPNGHTTYFFYNYAGRLVEKNQGEVKTTYTYDSLGRLYKTNVNDFQIKVTLYDALDRAIEERIEDPSGNVYRKTLRSYDIHGNICEERVYSDSESYSITKTIYNSQNLPVLIIDPLGHETRITYRQTDHLVTLTEDPLKQLTIQTYDPLNRIICTEIRDSSENTVAKQELTYDARGNKTRQLDHIYDGIHYTGNSLIEWEYDPMSQVLRETEQNEKSTHFSYLNGKLHHLTKPDGVTLIHAYEPLGLLRELVSSEGTIHYRYFYDAAGNLLQVDDLIHQNSTTRTYDRFSRIVSETLANGHTLTYNYDALGRLKTFTLPDNSKVQYRYDAQNLIAVDRNDYSYTQSNDLLGKPTESKLFTEISYQYDRKNRLQKITSPHYHQMLNYDPVGNITEIQGTQPAKYSYDALYQLLSESEIEYRHDSLNNRLAKNEDSYELNNLHQLLSDSHCQYEYDLNGNRVKKEETIYRYDALNRLISIDDLSYTYDPLGRLIRFQGEEYLYQHNTEIGTLDKLRITASGRTIAIEIDGIPYQTVQNHRGDIVTLLDKYGNLATTYSYTAFGETVQNGTIESPWQFTSQRYDAQTNLYYFPKRAYDPAVGRWLTPDPLGFADGPNLYAYVHNNPMTFIDPEGLWREELADFTKSTLHSFADDFTWGGSTYLTGERSYDTTAAKAGMYAGIATSMVVGLCTGTLEARILKAGYQSLKYLHRAHQGSKALKSIKQVRNVAKIEKAGHKINKIDQIAEKNNVGKLTNSLSKTNLTVGEYTYTKTVSQHMQDIVTKGPYKGEMSRPYMKSQLTINEIMNSSKPIPDPGGIPGAFLWKNSGSFRQTPGTWELVAHPNKKMIYHFNFVK